MAITPTLKRTLASAALLALVGCQGTDDKALAMPASEANSGHVQWPAIVSDVVKNPLMEARISTLLSQMTLEEKVGQMIQPEIKHVTPADIRQYHIGSVLNGGGSTPNHDKHASVHDWVSLADSYYRASVDTRNGGVGIPIMWGTDAVHGVNNVYGATLFPQNVALGAMHDPELMEKIGRVTARELAATGIDWDFSPTVAVSRDDRWGRAYESYSEGPEIVGAYAGRMIEGLQGEAKTSDFMAEGHVIATAKHFIGDGGTHNGVDRGNTQVSEKQLRDIHGAGYFSAIKAGVQAIMVSFSSWNGVRMHGNKYLLTDVLKGEMGFDGLLVGDWNGHGFIPGCTPVDCPQAANAGLDIYMAAGADWKELYNNTLAEARDGTIAMSRINDAVRRILRVKMRAGLFTKGLPSSRAITGDTDVLGSPAHRAVAREAVRKSLVMLKNKQHLLPLSRHQKVLVAGDGADNIGKQSGGWSLTWQGTGNKNSDFPGATSVYGGIKAAVTAGGGSVELSVDGTYQQKPDVAVVVFGEDPYAEMQGDVSNLLYKNGDQSDLKLLKKFKAAGIPVVSLFITGRPLWINPELNASDAFVVIWQPGTEGEGVADVVFRNNNGKINYPMQGKLSFSWPKRPDQVPLNRGDNPYDPLFAYGFGLTYQDTDTLGDNLSEAGLDKKQTQNVLALFNRRAIDPWRIEAIGDKNDRQLMTSDTISTSTVSVRAVDRNEQQDARRAVFNGKGAGQLAVSAEQRQDWSEYLRDKAALIFALKVDQAPTATTYLRLGCGSYCASDIDMTDRLSKTLAGKGWQTVSIDLACFPDAGEHFGASEAPSEFFKHVQSPFSFYTKGQLDMSFANVRVEKHTAADATMSCQ